MKYLSYGFVLLLVGAALIASGCDLLVIDQQSVFPANAEQIADPDYVSECFKESDCTVAGEICCQNQDGDSIFFTCEEAESIEYCPEDI